MLDYTLRNTSISNQNCSVAFFTSFTRSTTLPVPEFDERTLGDIIFGCLATVFACTWVSVHPNMPSPNDGGIRTFLVRLELMIWALVVPEMVIFWALRQWIGARRLAKLFEAEGWTKHHGFFAQMGGFVLMDGERIIEVLHPESMIMLLEDKKIRLPAISSKQISDRSKGDGFSKGLVVLQTSWFIAQCIGRRYSGLVITQLEIATLAYAALNAVMYYLWWNKPLDPRAPFEIQLQAISSPKLPELYSDTLPKPSPVHIADPVGTFQSSEGVPSTTASISFVNPTTYVQARPIHMRHIDDEHLFLRVVFFIYRGLYEMRNPVVYVADNDNEQRRMPTFYAFSGSQNQFRSDLLLGHLLLLFVSSAFGAIHILAWFSDFPSHKERIIWRIATTIILVVPLIYALPILLSPALVRVARRFRRSNFNIYMADTAGYVMSVLLRISQSLGPPVYILARLFILVEAVISLRRLPHTAYETISWSSYIPHI